MHLLDKLEKAWQDGELTQRGYLQQKAKLLEYHLSLATPNGTLEFGHTPGNQKSERGKVVEKEEVGKVGGGGGGKEPVKNVRAGMENRHIELNKVDDRPAKGLSRKLLEVTMVC